MKAAVGHVIGLALIIYLPKAIAEERNTNALSSRLDGLILRNIHRLPNLINLAKEKILSDKSTKKLIYSKFGSSVILASWKEILADWIIHNRTLGDFGGSQTLYDYGFVFFYGFGFGLPIINSAPKIDYPCGSEDFENTLHEFDLIKGRTTFLDKSSELEEKEFALDDKSRILLASLRIEELDVVLKTRLNCILTEESSYVEAAEVGHALEELIEAMKIRLKIGVLP